MIPVDTPRGGIHVILLVLPRFALTPVVGISKYVNPYGIRNWY